MGDGRRTNVTRRACVRLTRKFGPLLGNAVADVAVAWGCKRRPSKQRVFVPSRCSDILRAPDRTVSKPNPRFCIFLFCGWRGRQCGCSSFSPTKFAICARKRGPRPLYRRPWPYRDGRWRPSHWSERETRVLCALESASRDVLCNRSDRGRRDSFRLFARVSSVTTFSKRRTPKVRPQPGQSARAN